MAEKMKFNNILGQGYINLGLLQKLKKRKIEAKQSFSKAINLFKYNEAKEHLTKAERLISEL